MIFFVAQQTLSVTIRDPARLGALLEAIVNAGGNRIGSINYGTWRSQKYRDQARDLAVKAAREKTAALAQALGQDVGKAYSIDEVAESGFSAGLMANSNLDYELREKASAPSLAPGQKLFRPVTASFDLN